MKKGKLIAMLALCAALLLTLAACKNNEQNGTATSTLEPSETQTEIETETPTDIPTDSPNEDEIPSWWGLYTNNDYAVSISNFDGDSFLFTFFTMPLLDEVTDGAAALPTEFGMTAEYADIVFTLSADYEVLYITADENGEWADLAGDYARTDAEDLPGYPDAPDFSYYETEYNILWEYLEPKLDTYNEEITGLRYFDLDYEGDGEISGYSCKYLTLILVDKDSETEIETIMAYEFYCVDEHGNIYMADENGDFWEIGLGGE